MSAGGLYLVGGLALLLAVALPALLRRVALSAPIILVLIGLGLGFSPLPSGFRIDAVRDRAIIEHLTELTVLIALMGVGLALDRPLSLRSWLSWKRWHTTWRLLIVGMPLAIAASTLLGATWLGLGAGAALLFGSVLAPTDPVLAADVQVEGPTTEELDDIGEHDEVRFALTSEAGFNDALAFPFVYAAIYLVRDHGDLGFLGGWLAWEFFGKLLLGAAIGVACGWSLARVAFRGAEPLRFAELGEPLLALAATFVSYGLAEVVGGWGFIAVFACALSIRSMERDHDYHVAMHSLVEQLELVLTLLVLLLLGIAFADGLLASLDWKGAVAGIVVVFLVRPLTAGFALLGSGRRQARKGGAALGPREQLVTAFFGVRGIGSLYYLAYAFRAETFAEERYLWSVVGFTILLSSIVHGILATPAMRWVETNRERLASDSV